MMNQILVRKVKPETAETLKEMAQENRRSVTAEVNAQLDELTAQYRLAKKPKESILSRLIRGKPVTTRTQADIDAYVRELRDEWEH
jgi:hypothetical protein